MHTYTAVVWLLTLAFPGTYTAVVCLLTLAFSVTYTAVWFFYLHCGAVCLFTLLFPLLIYTAV